MIVLVHENHDKWLNVIQVQHFGRSVDHANLGQFHPWFEIPSKTLIK